LHEHGGQSRWLNNILIIQRYPPFVDGDGRSSISALIDEENRIRKEMRLAPTIHYIEKSAKVIAYLKKQDLSLGSVPDRGQRVFLFNRVALAPGGVVEIIDKNSLPAENAELFTRVLSMFGANIFGIDAIFEEGIDKSYKEQKCIFLEVNSRPYLKMHDYPRFGQAEDLSADYENLANLQVDEKDIF